MAREAFGDEVLDRVRVLKFVNKNVVDVLDCSWMVAKELESVFNVCSISGPRLVKRAHP